MAHPTTDQLLEKALAAHRRGSIVDAKRLYASVIGIDPSNAAAYGNLAIIAAQQGDLADAERLLRRAIALRPDDALSFNNLGLVLSQQGRLREAAGAHRRAAELRPAYAEAHFALGNLLKVEGRFDEALQCYNAALDAKPAFVEARNNAGVIFQMLGRLDEAASAYRKAIAARPAYVEALFNLGSVLHQMHELEAAEAAYRQVIAIDPKAAAAHNNLGTVLKDQGRPEAALAAFDRAIALKPDDAQPHHNRGTVLQQQARHEEALAAYARAIALRPDDIEAVNNAGIVLQEMGRIAEAIELYRQRAESVPAHAGLHNNMGTALLADGRLEEAKRAFERALACRPDFPEAAYNLGNALREAGHLAEAMAAWQFVLELRGDYADAFSQLVHHRALACRWDDHDAEQAKLLAMVRNGARIPPFYLFGTPATPADQLRAARQWIAPIQPPQPSRLDHGRPARGGRLRLGYLSGDLHQHATAQLMAGVFERHDRNRFEVIAYSYGPDDGSPMRARLESAFDRFVEIGRSSHRDAAERIHQDKIDILIDLKGYTHGSRPLIPALRPAPVQVSYLGYPATMGADFIDYILVDRFVAPESEQVSFSEKLVYLPVCYQPNDTRLSDVASHTSRRDHGLPEDGLVLCCFNNSYKLSPAMFDIWMRLLKAAPDSVVWLLATNDLAQENLRKEAAARGVDAVRLVFAPIVPSAAHLERHRHADLFLDTVPCNAHTTASDALWGGLPVLTCSGNTFAGRVAGSVLTAIGMPELITTSLEEYQRAALVLVSEPDRLKAMRRKIEQKRNVNFLFDLPKLTRAIEAAYEQMWQRRLAGEAPQAFSVENG